MALRSGIYIVPTDRWYVERAVWLIAGLVLIASTAAAALITPLFALFIIATGMASIAVSLTGFCIIGNALHLLGFSNALGTEESVPGRWYFMKTDAWYLERRIYIAVGIKISIASVLAIVHSLWWLAFTAFVGVAMVWFAATGFCIMANGLYWLGCEPRLAPDAPARRSGIAPAPVR